MTSPTKAESTIVSRLQACAARYQDFPAARVWLDDIEAVQKEAKENDRAALREAFVELVESGLIDEEESPIGLLDVAFSVTP